MSMAYATCLQSQLGFGLNKLRKRKEDGGNNPKENCEISQFQLLDLSNATVLDLEALRCLLVIGFRSSMQLD